DRRYVLFPGRPEEPRKGFALAEAVIASAAAQSGLELELVPLRGVPPERVALYMNGSHALLLTSLWEGSPNVIKEAMACDSPIVSVPVGDVPELLDGIAGCQVCPRQVEPLAAALERILAAERRTNGREALLRK